MSDQHFEKAKRLLKNWEFQKVYAQGDKKYLQGLTLYCLKVASDQNTRIGICVGRKVANAVVRNRVKRRLRELIRTYPQPLRPGYWLVVAANKDCVDANTDATKKNLYLLIKEALS